MTPREQAKSFDQPNALFRSCQWITCVTEKKAFFVPSSMYLFVICLYLESFWFLYDMLLFECTQDLHVFHLDRVHNRDGFVFAL